LDTFKSYQFELGRFIVTFAETEKIVLGLLWRMAGVDNVTARAIFSGTRTHAAISFIRRIHEAREETLNPVLDRCFHQLMAINATRDSLVHWGAPSEEEISNDLQAHAPRSLKVIPISPAIVQSMSDDLLTILAVFVSFLTVNGDTTKFDDDDLDSCKAALRPWRYTPAQPSKPGPRTPKTTRKPKAQPPASPA
jgi:hypothetical protein